MPLDHPLPSYVQRSLWLPDLSLGVVICSVPLPSPLLSSSVSEPAVASRLIRELEATLHIQAGPVYPPRVEPAQALLVALAHIALGAATPTPAELVTGLQPADVLRLARGDAEPRATALVQELLDRSYIPLHRSPGLRSLTLGHLLQEPNTVIFPAVDAVGHGHLALIARGSLVLLHTAPGPTPDLDPALRERIAQLLNRFHQ